MYYFNKGTQFQKGFPKYRKILTIDIKIFKKPLTNYELTN